VFGGFERTQVPLTELYQRVKAGVVRALNGSQAISFGTGSVVDDERSVLTCAHCVKGGAQIAIIDPQDSTRAILGTLVFSDANADIALLEFPSRIGSAVSFASSSTVATGNGAFVVGYPMGISDQTLVSAHVASASESQIRIDASVNQGNSGGPLFNLSGQQIGVVNAKHGSLSAFLDQIRNAPASALVSIGGVDPVKAIQVLISEMERNLNLGIGYAVPSDVIKTLHPTFRRCIP